MAGIRQHFKICSTLRQVFLVLGVCSFVLSTYAAHQLGDLAPRGATDGQLNAGDLVIMQQLVTGNLTPPATNDELTIGDVAPLGASDGMLNAADVLILQRAIFGEITLGTVDIAPLAPTLDPVTVTPTNENPYAVSGTSVAGASIDIYLNGVLETSTIALPNGSFATTVVLADGPNTIEATANTGGDTSPLSFPPLDVTFQLADGETLSGTITTDVVLYENTFYTVASDLTIQAGANLYVQPGAEVRFEPGANLFVNGGLIVTGTAQNNAVFTSNSAGEKYSGDWEGITVQDDGVVSIDFALIEYAFLAVQFFSGSDGAISNSIVENNDLGIYFYHGSGGSVTDSLIQNSGAGVKIIGSTTAFIGPDNTITNNTNGLSFKTYLDLNYINHNPTAIIRGNSIFNNNKNVITSLFEGGNSVFLDLQGNYWGTVDTNEIYNSMAHPTLSSYYPNNYPYNYPINDFSGYLDENGVANTDKTFFGMVQGTKTLVENETYIALSMIEVAPDATLVIPEGVTINFVANSAVGLHVNGTLSITGSATNPVTLSSNLLPVDKARSDWQGITVSNYGSANVGFAIVEYAVSGMHLRSGSNSVITDSTIQNNESGIHYWRSGGAVTRSLIQNNKYGIYIDNSPSPFIGPENVITNNTHGIFLDAGGYINPTAAITGNQIFGNITSNVAAFDFVGAGEILLDLRGNDWDSTDVGVILQSMKSYINYSVIYDVTGYLDENGVADTAMPLYGAILDNQIQANTNYLALSALEVDVGSILTIPEGVQISFPQSIGMVVNGTLNVTGTAGNQAVLTSSKASVDKTEGDWQGISVEDGAVVNINLALVEYADKGVLFYPGSGGSVTNSKIINNLYGIFSIGDGSVEANNPLPVVTNNSIRTNLFENYHTDTYAGTVNSVLNANSNWWGATNLTTIDSTIYDWNDKNSNRVIVDYSGFLGSEGGIPYEEYELITCPVVRVTDDGSFVDNYPDNDIAWISSNYTDVLQIERAFNNARLIDNSVYQYLKMPSQSAWDAMSIQAQGLYLINSERQARGIKPYEGISQNVITVTQNYADFLRLNNLPIGHYQDGKSPIERLNEDPLIRDNSDSVVNLESIYGRFGVGVVVTSTEAVVDAIYRWIYADKSDGNNWGHRDQVIQTGLKENGGETYREGLIGFGISIGDYDPTQSLPGSTGAVVVLNSFDPASTWDHSTTQTVDTDAAQVCNNRVVININELSVPVDQLKSLEIRPSDVYLTPGATEQLQVIATFLDDTQQDIASSSSFVADNQSVVDINAGYITALRNGYVYAVASANGVTSNSVLITVNEQTDTSNLSGTYAEDYLAYVPANASIEQYNPSIFSLFTGLVEDRAGLPLQDVTISIHNKPEYGSVKTDINGQFIFAAEAGPRKFVYRKSGYLTIHREVRSASNNWSVLDDVMMLAVDSKETAISLSATAPQIHTSTVINDAFGSRATTLVFDGINSATVTSADGSQRSLTDFSVSATEYELPESMPAALPKESAFTYCSELQITGVRDDETVTFDNPVVMYVDNFLGFNVGEIVPIGYYDRQLGDWQASDNGIVVKLLDTDGNGSVDGLDFTGDNLPDDINQNGSTTDEVAGLENYVVGATYWRGSFDHFTPVDYNWPYKPAADAISRGVFKAETSTEDKEQTELECTGSYVKPETQSFHEDIPITGTNLTLHYTSQRTQGYKHKIHVQVTGDTVPASMLEMIVKLEIGGYVFQQTLTPEANKEAEFIWDGKDLAGERMKGAVKGKISIGYKYDVEFVSAGIVNSLQEFDDYLTAWANVSNGAAITTGRDKFITWTSSTFTVQNTYENQLAEGWSLSNHHLSSPIGLVYKGDGEVVDTSKSSLILRTGMTASQYIGDDGYYKKGGSDIDFSITSDGTLFDTTTGLEWEYTDKPKKEAYFILAETYCGIKSLWGIEGWRLPTRKEATYIVDKSGNDQGYPIYELSSVDNMWTVSFNNPELKLLPVYCVRGTELDVRTGLDLKRNSAAEIVIDEGNGLMWQDDASTVTIKRSWKNSIDYCEASEHAGYLDWRLPNINELTYTLPNSVFVNQTTYPSGQTWGPTSPDRNPYWSSTPYAEFPSYAWAMESIGFTSPAFSQSDLYNVRCVRDNTESANSPYVFDEQGKHIETIDLNSGLTLTSFAYDTEGRLISMTDRFGDAITIQRQAGTGKPLSITTQDGYVTSLTIDANNDLKQVDYADNTNYQFIYEPGSLLTSKTDPNKNIYLHQFDPVDGRTTQTSDQEGGIWNFFNTRQGNSSALYGYTTAETNTYQTLRTLLPSGDVNKATTLFDGTQLVELNQTDELKQTLQGCAVTTVIDKVIDSKTKDPIPSAITITQPSGLQSVTKLTKSYGNSGADHTKQTLSINLNGKASSVFTDTTTGVTTATSAENRTTTLNVDPATLLLQSSQTPGLLDITYTYDSRGRQKTITTGTRTTTYTYNPVSKGDVTYITADDGKVTAFEYDALGRVKTIIYPDTLRTENIYDDNGNLTTLVIPTPANHGFTYTAVDKVETETTPKDGVVTEVTQYLYDTERNLKQITLPSSKIITNTYTNGLIDFTTTPEGVIDYAYTCNEKISSITEGAESVAYGYDGSLLEDIIYAGSLNKVISQTYNTDFNIATLTYAGQITGFAYDDDGLLTGTNGYTITRNALNGLPETLANGTLLQTRGFNGYREAEIVTTKVNTEDVYDYALTYNDLGKIITKTETLDDGTVNAYVYTYDDRRRLDTVTKNGSLIEDYGYDANGNRNLQTNTARGITAQNSSYNLGDQLTTDGTTAYDYDADGYLKEKVTASGTTTYQYSSHGRLLQVQTPDKTITYQHNAIGNRVAKLLDGIVMEKYLWLDKTMLLATYDKDDVLLQRYQYTDGNTPDSFAQGGATYYIVTDHLGTPRAITNSSGAIVKKLDYDSFGNVLSDSNPAFTIPFGFAGGLQDSDTGLVRFGFRDYDPDVGRWTARDPIGFAGGDTNLYGYVINDPVNFIDPTGENLIGLLGAITLVTTAVILINSVMEQIDRNNESQAAFDKWYGNPTNENMSVLENTELEKQKGMIEVLEDASDFVNETGGPEPTRCPKL